MFAHYILLLLSFLLLFSGVHAPHGAALRARRHAHRGERVGGRVVGRRPPGRGRAVERQRAEPEPRVARDVRRLAARQPLRAIARCATTTSLALPPLVRRTRRLTPLCCSPTVSSSSSSSSSSAERPCMGTPGSIGHSNCPEAGTGGSRASTRPSSSRASTFAPRSVVFISFVCLLLLLFAHLAPLFVLFDFRAQLIDAAMAPRSDAPLLLYALTHKVRVRRSFLLFASFFYLLINSFVCSSILLLLYCSRPY